MRLVHETARNGTSVHESLAGGVSDGAVPAWQRGGMELEASPRQIARSQRYSLGVPRSFTLAPDRDLVVFLRTPGGEDPTSCLWALQDGEEHLLADPVQLGWVEDVPQEERDRRERARERSRGIVAYSTDATLRRIAFALDGRLWLLDLAPSGAADVVGDAGSATAPRQLPLDGQAVVPQLDPTGRRLAYVRTGALRVLDVDGGTELLAVEPESATVSYGRGENTAMAAGAAYWWAPDGEALLVQRADTEKVERVFISDPSNPRAAPRQVPYVLAGTATPDLSLHVVTLDGRRTEVGWDHAGFEYLLAAAWDTHGPLLCVQSRDQRRVLVLAGDPGTGETTVLHEQADPVWILETGGVPCRTAGGRLVWTADLGDAHRLLVDGEPVTPAGVQVREVLGCDGEEVTFIASVDPTESHVWTWGPTAGARSLTSEPGLHRAARRGPASVRARHDEGGQHFTSSYQGRPDVAIGCHDVQPLLPPRVTWLVVGERRLRTALVLPSWYVAGERRLPVLMSPYGGPALQRVTRARHFHLCEAQWFAEQGFAVVTIDGSGTPGRGPAWDREVHGDSLSSVLADQVAGLLATAVRYPDLDLGRVGIRGWSFGGTLAAAAVLRRPDVFHCAISGAAPSDVSLYEAHYRERFLGKPQDNPEGYRHGSTLNEAADLERPLMLVHGMADDNVLVAHTLRMSAALFAAGKPHELLLLPGQTHMTTDEDLATQLLLRQLAFLVEHLAPEVPPG
jgi:dipeptidyl-peptidase-4